MRRSELVLSVALGASIMCSLWLWRELSAERARTAPTSPPREPVVARETNRESTVSSSVAATVAKRVDESASPSAIAASAAPIADHAAEDDIARERRLLKDPKYRQMRHDQARLTFARRRDNLIRLLGFTPEQADAVLDVQIDHETDQFEKMTPGYGKDQLEADERALQAKLGKLLGEEKRARLEFYMESRGTRMQLDEWRTQLTGSDSLREDQVEPLIAALHPEREQMQHELGDYLESLDQSVDRSVEIGAKRTELLRDATRRMQKAAATVLTGTQLEKFDAILQRELDERELQQRMDHLQSQSGSN